MSSLRKKLIEYSESVLNGDIVACQKHKWACHRFLFDLEREGTEEFPFVFDEERGQHFLDWMRLFKHRIGVLAGQRIKPHIIQKFVFGNIYGWIHKDTNLRRFNKGYWQVGRKNAKSQSLGCVASYEASAFGEPYAEVYTAGVKKEQSRLVWNETLEMIMNNPDLRDRFKAAYGVITHLNSGSTITPMSRDDRKDGDGSSPQCGIIDEYHAHDTSEFYDILDSGMGARLQPLLMIITTAGFDLNKPCYRVEYRYVSRILDPDDPVDNERYFVMINELDKDDDIKDPKNWEKANPILCSYKEGREYIESQLRVALDVPERMRTFITKNMNVWIDAKEGGYMEMNRWKKGVTDRFDLKRYPVWVGMDLSTTTDLTSLGFVYKLENGKYVVEQHSFMPEDRLQERMNTDNVPFDLWREQGHLTTTPGSVVDYSFVEQYLIDLLEEGYKIQEINYDKWNASHLSQRLENHGFTVVEIPQSIRQLSAPTKEFRREVYGGNVLHFDDPLLSWAISNAVQRQDAQENIMLDKARSTERIDPISAVINAFSRASVTEARDLSGHFLENWGL